MERETRGERRVKGCGSRVACYNVGVAIITINIINKIERERLERNVGRALEEDNRGGNITGAY